MNPIYIAVQCMSTGRFARDRSQNLLDCVYNVNYTAPMPTIVQSCRIEEDYAALLSRQAKRRHLEVSTLSSLYLKEKALEEEFPGIGFRDAAGEIGRASCRERG